VRFSFFKVDPAWRRLPRSERQKHKQEFVEIVGNAGREMMIYSYSLIGTRGDCDFMLWQVTKESDKLTGLASAINNSELAAYLSIPSSYVAMTRRSIYLNRYEEEYLRQYGGEKALDTARLAINPQGSKYLFVYPSVKTRDWYMLPHED